MIRNLNSNKSWLHAVYFALLSQVARYIPFNIILGSFGSFFSCIAICMPIAGSFGGVGAAFTCFALISFIKLCTVGLAKSIVSYHIPSLFASLYWSIESRIFRISIPLLCILLFVAHPTGAASFAYALYWIIPIGISLMHHRSLFLTALASTFTAHAVGSVLYLYCTTIPTVTWYTLMPIVPIERIAIALGMVALHKAYSFIITYQQKHLPVSNPVAE